MKKQNLLTTMLLLFALIVGSMSAWAEETPVYSLTFAKNTSASSYSSTHTTQSSSINWTVQGNQSVGDYLRVGGSNTTNTDRTLYSNTAVINKSIYKVVINHNGVGNGKNSSITVNSITIAGAELPSFTNSKSKTISNPSVSSSGSLEFTLDNDDTWDASFYFKITMNYKITVSNNCYLTINSVDFYEEAANPNPSISADNVNIAYDATSGSIAYTINNAPSPAGTLTANITAGNEGSWLTIGTISSTVGLTCLANTAAAARTATVTLTYTYGDNETKTKDVTVTQAGNPDAVNSISEINAVGSSYKVRGTVVATNARGFVIGDGTGYVYYYKNAAPTQSVGDKVSISGTTGTYGQIIQFTNTATVAEAATSSYDNTPAATVITAVPDYSTGYHLSTYLQFDGKLTKSNSNYLISVDGTNIQISYPTTAQGNALADLDGKTVRVKGYFSGINSSDNFSVMMESVEEIVIPTHTLTVNATNGSVEITGKTLDNGSCEVTENTSVTATATADEHYTFTSWTATGVTLTDATANPLTFTMPTNDVTLTANFTENAKHDATFYVQGALVNTDANVYEGEAITFPTNITVPTGYTLMGWTTAEIAGEQNNAPATLVSAANMGDDDIAFYAVFAIGSGSGEGTITLTNSTIQNNKTGKTSYSNDYSIEGWTGRYLLNSSGNNYFLQLGRNTGTTASAYNSHLTTPECSYNIQSITINTNNNTASGRTFYLCNANDIGAAAATNATYGYGSTTAANGSVTINVDGNTKQLHIYPDGTAYIESVSLTYSDLSYASYCTTVSTTATIAINAACTDGNGNYYGTFYTNRAYVMNDDLEGQVVKVDNSGKLTVQTAYEGGDVVPANTALLIYAIEANNYTVNYTNEDGADFSDENMLKGTLSADEYTEGDNCLFYRLTMHNGTTIGFWWGAEDGAAFKPGANKAYLAVPNGQAQNARGFVFGEETTGIAEIEAMKAVGNEKFYNLAGQRIAQPTKGLYIVNGKKYIVK